MIGGCIFPFNKMTGSYYAKISWMYNILPLLDISLAEYRKYGSTYLSSVVLWSSMPIIWMADPDVFRVATSDHSTFSKNIRDVR